MKLKLVPSDAAILHEVAAPVCGRLPWGLVRSMFRLLDRLGGIGLAAPQVGVSLRVFVTEVSGEGRRVYVNPRIMSKSTACHRDAEGCLSFPGHSARLWRHCALTIRARDRHGREFVDNLYDLAARCFQHELDHLYGVTIIDRERGRVAGGSLLGDSPLGTSGGQA